MTGEVSGEISSISLALGRPHRYLSCVFTATVASIRGYWLWYRYTTQAEEWQLLQKQFEQIVSYSALQSISKVIQISSSPSGRLHLCQKRVSQREVVTQKKTSTRMENKPCLLFYPVWSLCWVTASPLRPLLSDKGVTAHEREICILSLFSRRKTTSPPSPTKSRRKKPEKLPFWTRKKHGF